MWLLELTANTMFDLCSNTESAKTIKQLRDVVDSLSARLRTGGLRGQQSASDVQALHKQISQLEEFESHPQISCTEI